MSKFDNISDGINKRIFYVDLDDEIDGTEDEFEFGAWLPKDSTLPALCSSNCHAVSDTTFDQSEKITNALCTQGGADLVTQTPICNADAVDEITRKWPRIEPYALARPSESGEFDKGRFRRYKERSNYAKALLRSDKELEKLSRKIRLEIQQCEMLELAIEAERAANAGFSTFSARPSTFGLDALQGECYNLNLRRTVTFTGNQSKKNLRLPSDKMLKLVELRSVTEVIPLWKDLHSHMRTHLFRRRVHEQALIFREETTQSSSKHWNARFEHSASNIARQSLKFFGDFADMTVTTLKAHRMIHSRALCETTHLENCADNDSQASFTSTNSRFGPTLSSHLSPASCGKDVRRPHLRVLPGLVHPDETHRLVLSDQPATINKTLDMPFLPEVMCGGILQENAATMYHKVNCMNHEGFPRNAVGLSSPDDTTSKGKGYVESLEKCDAASCRRARQKTVADSNEENSNTLQTCHISDTRTFDDRVIQTPKRTGAQQKEAIGFKTPVRLRDIREHKERNGLQTVVTPSDSKIACFEPSSIIEHHESDNFVGLPSLNSPCHDDPFLALPSISSSRYDQNCGRPATRSRNAELFTRPDNYIMAAPLSEENHVSGAFCLTQPNDFETDLDAWEYQAQSPSGSTPPVTIATSHFRQYSKRNKTRGTIVPTLVESVVMDSMNGSHSKSVDHEEKKECDQSCRDEHVQILHRPSSKLRNCSTPSPLDNPCEDIRSQRSPRANEICENMTLLASRNAISFDLESHDDDSSSMSGTNEDHLFPLSATWGGQISQSTLEIRKTHSWPLLGLNLRERAFAIAESEIHRKNNLSFPSNSILGSTEIGIDDVTLLSDGHGICHTFPSTDENFQIAVEEMLSRLSPNVATWRNDVYLGEDENSEFLNNYFYCTKMTAGSVTPGDTHSDSRDDLRADSLCHVIGVDAMCSGIRFIFSEQSSARPDSVINRQRAVSLDGRANEKESCSNTWLSTLDGLLNQFGSSRKGERCEDPIQFDPPSLKKAAFTTN